MPAPQTPHGKPTSIWTADEPETRFPALGEDIEVDIAVVGGGIVGVTTAHLLQRAGRSVALLEARRVGHQTTGGSTAKVTSQHSLMYSTLARTFSEDTARAYGEANEWAIGDIEARARDLDIDCSFERLSAYTYTTHPSMVMEVRQEALLCERLGLPARFTEDVPLPFDALAAVAFDRQAQFDPVPYVLGVAQAFQRDGGQVFEGARVTEVDDVDEQGVETTRRVRLVTAAGHTVSAGDVVIATNLPFMNDGQYFAKALPQAHLVLAARTTGPRIQGAFISVDSPTRSLRSYRRGEETWLILCGASFKPGEEDTQQELASLEAYAREHFEVASVDHYWWNQDYYSIDHLPYVGRLTSDSEHRYLATGFSGWGLTNGDVAAHILADAVLGQTHRWAPIYQSTRKSSETDTNAVAQLSHLVRENLTSAKHLAQRVLPAEVGDPADLASGEGRVMSVDGERMAVARGRDGVLRAVSSACTHMGCELGWNAAMLTWDCACHGSCFDIDGAVLRGPAVRPLEMRHVEAHATEGGRVEGRR